MSVTLDKKTILSDSNTNKIMNIKGVQYVITRIRQKKEKQDRLK